MGRTRRALTCFTLAVAAVIGAATPAWAPQPQKPEKLVIDSIKWNSVTQAFEVHLSASYGTATAGGEAGWTTLSTLDVVAHARLGPVESAVERAGDPVPGERVRLRPIVIAWDRNGGRVSGPVDVAVTVELRNPAVKVSVHAEPAATVTGFDAGIAVFGGGAGICC